MVNYYSVYHDRDLFDTHCDYIMPGDVPVELSAAILL